MGACLDKGEDLAAIQQDLGMARAKNLLGTPGFVIAGQTLYGATPGSLMAALGASLVAALLLDHRETTILLAGLLLIGFGLVELAGGGFSLAPAGWLGAAARDRSPAPRLRLEKQLDRLAVAERRGGCVIAATDRPPTAALGSTRRRRGARGGSVRLDVVVAPDCGGCEAARAVASAIQERFPDLRVTLIELDGREPPPERVVATPTYLLDGTVVSLGNPRLADLVRAIERHAGAPPVQRATRRRWQLPWHRRTAESG